MANVLEAVRAAGASVVGWVGSVIRPRSVTVLKYCPVARPAGFHQLAVASSATATNAPIPCARTPMLSKVCAEDRPVHPARRATTRQPRRTLQFFIAVNISAKRLRRVNQSMADRHGGARLRRIGLRWRSGRRVGLGDAHGSAPSRRRRSPVSLPEPAGWPALPARALPSRPSRPACEEPAW